MFDFAQARTLHPVTIQRGPYISLNIAETPDPVRMLPAIKGLNEAASKAGKRHPCVAVCGERAGRLGAEGKADLAIRLERLCQRISQVPMTWTFCARIYCPGRKTNMRSRGIFAEHSAVSYR
jgi:hypothetical protein